MNICQSLITEYEYGTRLKEDSSREFIEHNNNLKLICRKVEIEEITNRLLTDEFDLLQKMTTTKKNEERNLKQKYFRKFFGVATKNGPYQINSGTEFFFYYLFKLMEVTSDGSKEINEINFLHANMIRNPLKRRDRNNFIAMQRPIDSIYNRFWQMIQTFAVK